MEVRIGELERGMGRVYDHVSLQTSIKFSKSKKIKIKGEAFRASL